MTKVLFNINQGMKSGYDDAVKRKYKKFEGVSGDVWLVAVQPNEADNIYVSGGPNSQGFGGAILTFELEGGGVVKLQGPWHSNSHSLFADTGYDCRDKHLTFGIVAEEREPGSEGTYAAYLYSKIIHEDKEPTLGVFKRIEDIAQQWSDENGKECYYSVISSGGGSASRVRPKKTEERV